MSYEKKLYGLTSAQKLLLYSQTFCIKKCVNNIATSILFHDELDFDLLRKAIKTAVNRNEAMRLRLVKVDKEVKQYFLPEEDKEVGFYDFSGQSEEKMEKIMHKWAGKNFKLYESSLNEIIMFQSFDGWRGIFLKVHHTTMDSYSIMMFYKDVIDIYYAYQNGTELPPKLYSYETVLQKELAYDDNSKMKQADIAYWKELFNMPEPIYTNAKGYQILEQYRLKKKNALLRSVSIVNLIHVNAKHEVYHINKIEKEKILEFCNSNKVTLQSLLMTAVRTFLSYKNNCEDDISINATVARRGTLEEKRCGGSRVICFPLRTIIEKKSTFLDAVCTVRDELNQHFRHSNLSFMQVIQMRREAYHTSQTESYESMAVTYSPVQIEFDHIECRSKWYCNGAASQGLYLTVMHNIQTKGLDFYFEYLTYKFKPADLEELFCYLRKLIDIGINNPAITVGELLTMQDLEDIGHEDGSLKTGTFA